MQHLQPNTTLLGGKYRIEKVLGQGGFGITYLATQVSLNRLVAIKEFFMKDFCIRGDNTRTIEIPTTGSAFQVEQYKRKFWKETKNLFRMSHPNIIKVFEVFEENDTVYYVMPYLSGGSLQEYVNAHGAMSEGEAMKYIRQIASALKYMHEKEHICHYDVKPANILLDENKNAILIDFGISKNYDAAGQETSTTPIGMSEGYAPIEQYQKIDEFSPVSDVYALGATLYFLLHGKPPVNAASRAGGTVLLMNKYLSQDIKDVINMSMKISKRERARSVDVFLGNINTSSQRVACSGKDEENESTIIEGSKRIGKTSTIYTQSSTSSASKTSTTNRNGGSTIGWIIGIVIVAIACFFMLSKHEGKENIESENTTIADSSTNIVIQDVQEVIQEEKKDIQLKTSSISENYAGRKYNYNIKVENGILDWTFSGEGGNDRRKLDCNPNIDADVIIAEFKGLAYWDIASELIFYMVEEQKFYSDDLYESGKDALSKCVSNLSKARGNCPKAYEKAHDMYKNLINAENDGADALWDELMLYSYALGEHPLSVCDIY
ncbi:MAG: serine/threonine protein kinase [Prevotella sp.]|nr:serine/threonine protein kinase [Prevotella sp.]